MIIEAVKPLRVVLSDVNEVIRLTPGIPRDLPEEYALKLLAKASRVVRIVEPVSAEKLIPGVWISWKSPLLGICNGQIAMSPEKGWLVVRRHSVTGNLALIALDSVICVMAKSPSEG